MAQILDRHLHGFPELHALPFGQRDEAGLVFIEEIIHVAEIPEFGIFRTNVLQDMLDRCQPPRAREPRNEYVVARAFYAYPQLERFHGALLPDDLIQRLYIRHGFERKNVLAAKIAKLFGLEFLWEVWSACFHRVRI